MSGCCAPRMVAVDTALTTAPSTQIVKPSDIYPEINGKIKTVTMSALDHVTAPYMIIRLPFLYTCRLDPSMLATSLAAILPRFPIFAGHVRTTKDGYFEVAYTSQGACLQCTSSRSRLSDLLPPIMQASATTAAAAAPFKPPDLVPFYPDMPKSLIGFINQDVPILHAKLTHLADGGSCLVVAVPHLLADLDTCKTLIAAWAEEYSSQQSQSENGGDAGHLPVIDEHHQAGQHGHYRKKQIQKGVTQPPILAAEVLAAHAAPTLPPGYESPQFEDRTFGFMPKMVGSVICHLIVAGGITTLAYHVPSVRLAQLKTEASKGLQDIGTASPGWISTNDALAARVWQALAQLPQKSNSGMFYAINLRKRVRPALPSGALGNCAWTVEVGEGQAISPSTASLGELAAAIRGSIQGLDLQEVSQSLKWVEDHLGSGKAMPVVIRGANNILLQSGGIVYSNWEWDREYRSAAFGNGVDAAPVWHQPMEPRAPNCVFALPAPPCAPGGGSVVFITLHKKLATALKTLCPAL